MTYLAHGGRPRFEINHVELPDWSCILHPYKAVISGLVTLTKSFQEQSLVISLAGFPLGLFDSLALSMGYAKYAAMGNDYRHCTIEDSGKSPEDAK